MAKPLVAFCAILLAIGTSQVFSASIGTRINEDEAVTLVLSDKNQNVITSALIGGVLGRLASNMNIKRIEFGTPDIVDENEEEDNTGTGFKITEGKDGITMKIDGDTDDDSNVEVTLHKDEDENEAEATVTADIQGSGDGAADAAATDGADTTGDSEAKGQEAADAGATVVVNGGDAVDGNGGVDITVTVKGDENKGKEQNGDEDKGEEEKGDEDNGEEEKVDEDNGEEEKADEDNGEEEKADEDKGEDDEKAKADGSATITVTVQKNGDTENEVDIDEDSNSAAESLSVESGEDVSQDKDTEESESDSDSDSESDESKDLDEVKGSNTLELLSASEEDLYSPDSSIQEDSDEIISLEKSDESSEWPPLRPLLPLAPLPSQRPLPPHRPLSPQAPLPWWLKDLKSQKTVHHIVHHVGSPVVLGSGPYGLPAHHLLGSHHYHSGAKLLPPSLYGAPLPPSMALPLHYLDQTWGPQSQLALQKLLAEPCKQAALEKAALAARKEALLAKAKIQKDIAADIALFRK